VAYNGNSWSGRSADWKRARFGSVRSEVQILSPRPFLCVFAVVCLASSREQAGAGSSCASICMACHLPRRSVFTPTLLPSSQVAGVAGAAERDVEAEAVVVRFSAAQRRSTARGMTAARNVLPSARPVQEEGRKWPQRAIALRDPLAQSEALSALRSGHICGSPGGSVRGVAWLIHHPACGWFFPSSG
jgi:hypothetical protein